MKPILLIAFTVLGLFLSAQTDSTDIKLEHYKELFTKGLISAQDYEILKDRLLGIGQQRGKTPKTEPLTDYSAKENKCRKVGKSCLISASVITFTGACMVGGGYAILAAQGGSGYGLCITGITLMCVSTPLWVAGGVQIGRSKYYKKKLAENGAVLSFHPDITNTASIGFRPSPTMGIRLTF